MATQGSMQFSGDEQVTAAKPGFGLGNSSTRLADLDVNEKRALLLQLLKNEASRTKTAPLSFAQARLWFLDQLEPDTAVYNIPAAVTLPGKLSLEAFKRSVNEIVRRHEALR